MRFWFGDQSLDTERRELSRNGVQVPVEPQVFDLLVYLLSNRNRVSSKDDLIASLWGGRVVSDATIDSRISSARRAIGDRGDTQRWIRTFSRKGIRFVGEVREEALRENPQAPPPLQDRAASWQAETVVSAPQGSHLPDGSISSPASAPALSAERRHLTVMFCGLLGPRNAMHDPEDLRKIFDEYHSAVADEACVLGGCVASYVGSSIMVCFGYPEAHEDDGERAIRTAIALCDRASRLPAVASRFSARIGIATGIALVSHNASANGRPQIIGEALDRSACLLATAAPGMVLVDEATRQIVGGLFEFSQQVPSHTEASLSPVPTWRVLGPGRVESRFEALRAAAMSPLVGRDEEIGLLARRWQSALRGAGQVVLISGEPGIGKSRLVAAFQEHIKEEPYTRIRYFCSPYHVDSALHPVIHQLENAAGFEQSDTAEARLDKVAALLAPENPSQESIALIADLMSIPASETLTPLALAPARKKQKTFDIILQQLDLLVQKQPVLMVFEDAQWIDPTSRELLDLILARAPNLPLLVIITHRPDFRPLWIGMPNVTSIFLGRLDRSQAAALVQVITANSAPLPAAVVGHIVERSDGVPLFVEELTKVVVGVGADKTAAEAMLSVASVPTTLHASLLARLDGLGSAKDVAQIGAAIGREFPFGLLAAVARKRHGELVAALDRLVAAQLLFQRGSPPDAVYRFKHALIQDAAYGTLLRGLREKLHAQIANAIIKKSVEHSKVQPELVAHHWTQAGVWDRAVEWRVMAAQRALSRSALAEAISQLTHGLDLLVHFPEGEARQRSEIELQLLLGTAFIPTKGYASKETGRSYTRARELCEALGDEKQLVRALWGQYLHHLFRAELLLAVASAERLRDLGVRRGDSGAEAHGELTRSVALVYAGEFAAAEPGFTRALALYDSADRSHLLFGQDTRLSALAYGATNLVLLGHVDRAIQQSDHALSEAQNFGHLPTLAFTLSVTTRLHSIARDDDGVRKRANLLMKLATEHDLPFWWSQAAFYLGVLEAQEGHSAQALCQMREAVRVFDSIGTVRGRPMMLGILAREMGRAGQTSEALAALEAAMESMRGTDERWEEAELFRLKGELLLARAAPGDRDLALACFQEATGIAHLQQAIVWELRAATSFARATCGHGSWIGARDLLISICERFGDRCDTPDLREARDLLRDAVMH